MRFIFSLLFSCLLAIAPISAGFTAKEKQPVKEKPLVVLIFNRDCEVESPVLPVMKEVEREYADRVQFVELDVSEGSLPKSRIKAKELGIAAFLDDALDYLPDVAVFDLHRKVSSELLGNKPKASYEAAIEKVVSRLKK
jgi:hypothetical protein